MLYLVCTWIALLDFGTIKNWEMRNGERETDKAITTITAAAAAAAVTAPIKTKHFYFHFNFITIRHSIAACTVHAYGAAYGCGGVGFLEKELFYERINANFSNTYTIRYIHWCVSVCAVCL